VSLWHFYYPTLKCDGCRHEVRSGERYRKCGLDLVLCSDCGKDEEKRIAAGTCAWCGKRPVDRARLGDTGQFIYWCGRHKKIGRESVTDWQPSSKGSLAYEIRKGQLGGAQEALR
jgi:hypothetical protein